jgi:hypothetical protein
MVDRSTVLLPNMLTCKDQLPIYSKNKVLECKSCLSGSNVSILKIYIYIIYLFIGVLLVTTFHSLIQQWVQTDKEQHVYHEQRDNPDYNDNNNLKIKLFYNQTSQW